MLFPEGEVNLRSIICFFVPHTVFVVVNNTVWDVCFSSLGSKLG
jgi:hypothetical protein